MLLAPQEMVSDFIFFSVNVPNMHCKRNHIPSPSIEKLNRNPRYAGSFSATTATGVSLELGETLRMLSACLWRQQQDTSFSGKSLLPYCFSSDNVRPTLLESIFLNQRILSGAPVISVRGAVQEVNRAPASQTEWQVFMPPQINGSACLCGLSHHVFSPAIMPGMFVELWLLSSFVRVANCICVCSLFPTSRQAWNQRWVIDPSPTPSSFGLMFCTHEPTWPRCATNTPAA